MKIAWTYVTMGLLTLCAAAIVAGGETAMAELRLAEASTSAAATGVSAVYAPTPPATVATESAD